MSNREASRAVAEGVDEAQIVAWWENELARWDPLGSPLAPYVRTLLGLVSSQSSLLQEAREALDTAHETIKALHGPVAWEIYERASPEMKQIDAARAKLSVLLPVEKP